jgi:hypothetical protein
MMHEEKKRENCARTICAEVRRSVNRLRGLSPAGDKSQEEIAKASATASSPPLTILT